MTGVLIVLGLVAGFVLFDQLMLAAERRDWVRWRRSPPTAASAGTALLEILSVYAPEHRHVVDERLATDADESTDDDPLAPIGPLDPRDPRHPPAPRDPSGAP